MSKNVETHVSVLTVLQLRFGSQTVRHQFGWANPGQVFDTRSRVKFSNKSLQLGTKFPK